jgi:hypothetical protein
MTTKAWPRVWSAWPSSGRVLGVAGKHLYRQGPAAAVAQQPDDDLPLALLAVAVVAEGRQWPHGTPGYAPSPRPAPVGAGAGAEPFRDSRNFGKKARNCLQPKKQPGHASADGKHGTTLGSLGTMPPAGLFTFLYHHHRLLGALFLLNQEEEFTVRLFGVTNPIICPFHPRHDILLVVNFFNDKNSAARSDGII